MSSQFNKRDVSNNKSSNNKSDNNNKNNPVEISNLPASASIGPFPPVPPRPSKEELNKFKFYKKNSGKTAPQ